MSVGPQLLLVGAVAVVGVLHTVVPDHWVPITLIARQRGWTKAETALASLQAGAGHVLSTLAIALVVWAAGVAVADRFGHFADTAASVALVLFGGWIALSSLGELRRAGGHSHRHEHGHGHSLGYEVRFAEHDHGHEHARQIEPAHDPLYAPLRGDVAVLTRHAHTHRHGAAAAHTHWHDHLAETAHEIDPDSETDPPRHEHRHKMTARTALLFILGSSPMVEGIPAFFAAGKYGWGLIAVMSLVFAIATIATYMLLCVYSTAGLQRVSFGRFERYGEAMSGAFIALVGVAFWVWPVL